MDIVHPDISRYAENHTSGESELLNELKAKTNENLDYSDMLSGPLVGRFLAMMVNISGAERILELGTFTGYSALCMAEALPENGELITCEYNERYENIARSFFKRSGYKEKIRLIMGDALETIPSLNGTFDMVFLDADKINYPKYYELIKPRMNKGSLMIVDNVFWSGTVLKPEDPKAKAIDRFNKVVHNDAGVEHVMLTIRDGLSLVRKL